MGEWANHHCNVVEIAGIGVLIEGPAGSGKTSLSLGLLEHARLLGIAGNLVCDDQVHLYVRSGKLVANAPDTLGGKIEIRGLGLKKIEYVKQCEIDLVARLVEDDRVERMPEPQTTELSGVEIPLILLPRRHEMMARRIVFGWIECLA